MKTPSNWDETDLLRLIATKAEEASQLEFKRADSLENSDSRKKEISKDVSAFANSGGGTIVYGIEESPDPPRYARGLSPIDPTQSSKEWLEQVINSRIHPRIHGLTINAVELSSVSSGQFAYVVSIPEGVTAHQASDLKYYKRFNFESVAMEDYEIRLVMNRSSKPFYDVRLEARQKSSVGTYLNFRFACFVENVSEIVGHELSAILLTPRDIVQQPDDFKIDRDGVPYSRIPTSFVESSHSAPRSAIAAAHPYTPYSIEFSKTLHFRIDSPPEKKFTVFLRIFDQFGLAVEAPFHVYMPGLEIEPLPATAGSRRTPNPLNSLGAD